MPILKRMIVLNCAHPLLPEHVTALETLAGQPIDEVVDVPIQFEHDQPFEPQMIERLDAIDSLAGRWQTVPLLVNPPAFSPIAALLIALLHGRAGYFPTVVRWRPVEGAITPRFEPTELLNLQAVRDRARGTR